MEMTFYKYEGAGNDFILFDDRGLQFPDHKPDLVKFLCDRKFGIGADGLMLLRRSPEYDFGMVYFNSDGKEGSMCGNGGRCIAAFAQKLGMIQEKARFRAIDGTHMAEIRKDGSVRLRMMDVSHIETGDGFFFLDTGSPHYVKFLPSVENLDVFAEGRKIRYSDRFTDAGTNVNFVADLGERIYVRTYERGVENETLACGTGVVASVICAAILKGINHTGFSLPAKVRGGELQVSLYRKDQEFTEIWLDGPATFVFEGLIHIPA